LLRECFCGGFTDTPGTAGDENDFVLEVHCCLFGSTKLTLKGTF